MLGFKKVVSRGKEKKAFAQNFRRHFFLILYKSMKKQGLLAKEADFHSCLAAIRRAFNETCNKLYGER